MRYDGGLYRWRHEERFKYRPEIEFTDGRVWLALAIIAALVIYLIT